nr:hypothetical protein [Paraburkholderia domus]
MNGIFEIRLSESEMRKQCGAGFGFLFQTRPVASFGARKLGVMRERIGGELGETFCPGRPEAE